MSKLKIDRGTTYAITGTVKKDGVLVDLSNATIRFTMKSVEWDDSTDDSTAALKKDLTNGTAEGTYEVDIYPDDTASLEPNTYFYSIKVDVNSDFLEVYEVDEGTITLDGDPTNRPE